MVPGLPLHPQQALGQGRQLQNRQVPGPPSFHVHPGAYVHQVNWVRGIRRAMALGSDHEAVHGQLQRPGYCLADL